MIRCFLCLVVLGLGLAPMNAALAQSQAGGTGELARPEVEACLPIARQQIRDATAGLGALTHYEAQERLDRAQIQLRESDAVQTMLRCLMSRTRDRGRLAAVTGTSSRPAGRQAGAQDVRAAPDRVARKEAGKKKTAPGGAVEGILE